MRKTINRLKTYLLRHREIKPEEVEELRNSFKSRYHNFKLLLTANNKSLEIMADIERALQGNTGFGMPFIRASCTALSVNVFRMIKNLDDLAPEKYKGLYTSFDRIKQNIDGSLTQKKNMVTDSRLVIPFDSVQKEMSGLVGNKMANLGEIRNTLHLDVPDGFVVTSSAYEQFFGHNDLYAEINRRFQSADIEDLDHLYGLSSDIQQLIIRSEMPDDLEKAILDACMALESRNGRKTNVAVRSSAIGEDAPGASFAGQYRSVLNVDLENIIHAYKEVVAGKYSLPAITYRLNRGFKDEDIAMCVACMTMVDATSGGVVYTCNPLDFSDDSFFINAVRGLPKSVVDSSGGSDLIIVSKNKPAGVIFEEINDKNIQYACLPEGGIKRIDSHEDYAHLPSIDHDMAIQLAGIAEKIAEHYHWPQDIEWAVTEDSRIHILQCRPLKQSESPVIYPPDSAVEEQDKPVVSRGGITASPGCACGDVYPVTKNADILRFPKGSVLLVRQALPSWAPMLNRACAVLAEQGNFAGHLANVAREFRVPALFNVSGIMSRLTKGESVTVDATGRAVYRGRQEYLLSRPGADKNLMEGSPVYETLKDVSKHIVKLNLLDPESLHFTPAACSTLHDITRFIHEKSVHEMFSFGKDHRFSELSSKQLFFKAPMQWWVLNLDDGFKEKVKGKYVHLDNIVSIPMLAFWEGFAAISWAGPPPIDGKGLISVMFQSTANTALTPGVRSQYAAKNYFMISKHYCSLNTRLGYHFSTMEALVGDRVIENYVSFQFKGGAADYRRRLKRVRFIADILEHYGFNVTIREDNLIARIEGLEKRIMIDHIKILGYLTLHTRQLDMIMANSASVDRYREKISSDIERIMATDTISPESIA